MATAAAAAATAAAAAAALWGNVTDIMGSSAAKVILFQFQNLSIKFLLCFFKTIFQRDDDNHAQFLFLLEKLRVTTWLSGYFPVN